MLVRPVTVIIPARNAARTVRRAVTSTLRDLDEQDRVLVMDDGSTDSTLSAVDSLEDHRLRVSSSAVSRGVAGALNVMLEEVTTPLVARMDADDLVLPGRFGRQRIRIEAGSDVEFTSRINFGATPLAYRPISVRGYSTSQLSLAHVLINPVAHSSMMARTEVLRAAGGYRSGPAEDYDLWMRLHALGFRLQSDSRPGILYRMHRRQVTRQRSWLDSLRDDPALTASHFELLRHLGWTGPSCWQALNTPYPDSSTRDLLRELKAFMEDSVRNEGQGLRRLVQRTFARRGL